MGERYVGMERRCTPAARGMVERVRPEIRPDRGSAADGCGGATVTMGMETGAGLCYNSAVKLKCGYRSAGRIRKRSL